MKEINLRKYYPHYAQDMMVEVPDEVVRLVQETLEHQVGRWRL